MKVVKSSELTCMQEELSRPSERHSEFVLGTVARIFDRVETEGDQALLTFAQEFDGHQLCDLKPTAFQVESALKSLSHELCKAVEVAEINIRTYHAAQQRTPLRLETAPGIICERRVLPIERVGLYVPGGTAPLFSTLLMLAVPAKLAGCKEIAVVSPPPIHPITLAVAEILELTELYQVGGAQAIAALSLGTDTIRPVSKIFGPGNQYVTAAKQYALQTTGVAVDLPAGPSEVLVVADDSANPNFVAADLLSQAEHGVDSQVILLSDSEALITKVVDAIQTQLESLSRKDLASQVIDNSVAVLTADLEQAISISNDYAPEHLIIACQDVENLKSLVTNAGSVFLGYYTPESLGDYASGANHTLPTGGSARAYSGVSLESFQKVVTFQSASEKGLRDIAPVVECMALAEGLDAHAKAVAVRFGR